MKKYGKRRGGRAAVVVVSLTVAAFATLLACRSGLVTKSLFPAALSMDKPAEATDSAVTTADLNMRSGGGTSYPVICTLKKGISVQLLTKLAADGDWAQVRTGDGQTGWCSKKYLETAGASAASSIAKDSSAAAVSSPYASAAVGSSAVTTDGVNVRTGKGTSFPVSFTLAKGTTVQLLGSLTPDTEWVQIRTAGGQTGWCAKEFLDAADTAEAALKNSSSSPNISLATAAAQVALADAQTPLSVGVSIAQQRVTVCDARGRIVEQFVCSTGEQGSGTPTGTFRVAERGKSFYSKSSNEGGYYWTQFDGDYLFHSVPFDKNYRMEPEEAAKLGTPASHGCVRLKIEDAKWIYDHIPRGTVVTIR